MVISIANPLYGPKPELSRCPVLCRSRGFTLLEVLIALSIFAILGLASYKLLSTELQTQSALEQQSQQQNHWQRGMARLTQDLQQATNRSIREDYGEREAALIGDDAGIVFSHLGWMNPLQRTRSDIQRVAYRIQQDDEGQSYLQRSFWFQLDRAPASEPVRQQLLPGVQQLQLRYYHAERQQWLPFWPPVDEPNIGLPQAIEVTLVSPELGEIQRLVSLHVRRETTP